MVDVDPHKRLRGQVRTFVQRDRSILAAAVTIKASLNPGIELACSCCCCSTNGVSQSADGVEIYPAREWCGLLPLFNERDDLVSYKLNIGSPCIDMRRSERTEPLQKFLPGFSCGWRRRTRRPLRL